MDNASRSGGGFVGAVVVIVLLITLIYVLVYFVRDWSYSAASAPWLVEGSQVAKQATQIPGALIPPSNDGRYGLEFSYSFWVYVNEWNTPGGIKGGTVGGVDPIETYKHIMHKGDQNLIFQAPGFWMDDFSNRIVFRMNTFEDMAEECMVDNIPIGKWVNIIAVVIGKNVDLYVNGGLKNRCEFKGIPMQNMGDVYIGGTRSFDGFISRMRYYSYALPIWQVEQVFGMGPSDLPPTQPGAQPPYLAPTYWFSN